MRYSILPLALLMALGTAAQAECYADYKAKQDDPLRLHYGVAEIDGSCSVATAEQELEGRLSSGGWQLLEVLGTFDRAAAESRRNDAGDNYLRY
ncbi:hypothetical protein [Roseisalinus antarcticus]|uniref:DUF4177 domain-containing protein n=1 Tax=Roseisalinus antarcticus TaxID=254357 RepID=A0A1Y5SJT8_9RHOB|nr:hypothetical protein [Roseisalinus antarcticus]SLN42481.1 hypothetical protein ROA7023_01699 [Roseisalinus antarcticus]